VTKSKIKNQKLEIKNCDLISSGCVFELGDRSFFLILHFNFLLYD